MARRSRRGSSELAAAYDPDVAAVQLNLLGSHDTPRLRTVLGGDVAAVRLAFLLQATLPGAPCVYYGDEVGLVGANDPANRGGVPVGRGALGAGAARCRPGAAPPPGGGAGAARRSAADGRRGRVRRSRSSAAAGRRGSSSRSTPATRPSDSRSGSPMRRVAPAGIWRPIELPGFAGPGRDPDRRRERDDRPRGADRRRPPDRLTAALAVASWDAAGRAAFSVILRGLWQIYRSTSEPGSPSSWPGSSMSRRRSRGRSRHWVRSGDAMCSCSMATTGSAPDSSPSSAGGSRSLRRTNRPASTRPTTRPTSWSSLWTLVPRRSWRRDTAEAGRVLRPGGRLLVVHDYGRDDVSRLRGDLPEYGLWSRRDGPFLGGGFKVRSSTASGRSSRSRQAAAFLEAAFGAVGREVAAAMKRPRLSYNVAVYHRTFGTDR